jgi:hypothetical protein
MVLELADCVDTECPGRVEVVTEHLLLLVVCGCPQAVSNGQPMPQQPERDSPVTTGPSTAQPAVQPGSAAGAQPVSSRDGTTGTTPAGADAAKSTRVKSSAGGLRGASSSLLLFQGLVTCALAVLLL